MLESNGLKSRKSSKSKIKYMKCNINGSESELSRQKMKKQNLASQCERFHYLGATIRKGKKKSREF